MLSAVLVTAAEEDAAPNPLVPALYDIVWSGVVFAVILFFFFKYVLPRVNTMLDERSALIEGQIAQADEAKAQADAALEEYRAQLADARGEAARIREQARLDGTKILADLKEQATAEAARITAAAQSTIEAERQAALVSLRSEVGTLAVQLASGVLRESLTDDVKTAAIVDRFLADLESETKAEAGS